MNDEGNLEGVDPFLQNAKLRLVGHGGPPWGGVAQRPDAGWAAAFSVFEGKVIALCCGAVPSGHARWTLRLLAERAVELEIVEAVSHETVRRCLKKTN